MGKTVLIGDAARSMHFSIGSDTRVAMDDSIALAEVMREMPSDPIGALAVYEARRRPEANKLIAAAERSYLWYENIRAAMERLAPMDVVLDFMTRTGRMPVDRLRVEHPEFMARYERDNRAST